MLKLILNSKKIVIYGNPRTGTTSLWHILMCHPQIKHGQAQPFGPDRNKTPIENEEDLIKRTHKLFLFCDLLKHTTVELKPQYFNTLLKTSNKLIYLNRKNILKQMVSDLLGIQTNVWNKDSKNWKKFYVDKSPFKAIDLSTLERKMNLFKRNNKIIEDVLTDKVMKIIYEDFYLIDEKFQIVKLKEIFNYLKLEEVINDKMLDRLRNSRQNTEEVYLRIPNIQDIENNFGNEENGWIFK